LSLAGGEGLIAPGRLRRAGMQSPAKTVREYLNGLPEDARREISRVRKAVLDHLPAGYEEGMQFGMIAYSVPVDRFPNTYNGKPLMFAALAAQKNYHSLYLMSVYGDPTTQGWFHAAYRESGKRLEMGKSCIRFKRAEDLALDVIGEALSRVPVEVFLARVEGLRRKAPRRARPRPRSRRQSVG
jgi:hypothetical protein